MKIDAKLFFKDFKEFIYENSSTTSVYTNNTSWTKRINKEIVPEILLKILKKENLDVFISHEYYRVDVLAGYNYKNRLPELKGKADSVGMNFYAWEPMIAFEHENKKADWYDEVIKLLFLDCPLRVVVGYNDSKNRESDLNKLEILLEIIKAMDLLEKLECEEFLIIIGNSGVEKSYKESDEMIKYKGYLYNKEKGKFEEL